MKSIFGVTIAGMLAGWFAASTPECSVAVLLAVAELEGLIRIIQ